MATGKRHGEITQLFAGSRRLGDVDIQSQLTRLPTRVSSDHQPHRSSCAGSPRRLPSRLPTTADDRWRQRRPAHSCAGLSRRRPLGLPRAGRLPLAGDLGRDPRSDGGRCAGPHRTHCAEGPDGGQHANRTMALAGNRQCGRTFRQRNQALQHAVDTLPVPAHGRCGSSAESYGPPMPSMCDPHIKEG